MTESGLGFEKFAVVDEMCGHAVPEPAERRLGDLGELAEAAKPVRQGSRGHVRLARGCTLRPLDWSNPTTTRISHTPGVRSRTDPDPRPARLEVASTIPITVRHPCSYRDSYRDFWERSYLLIEVRAAELILKRTLDERFLRQGHVARSKGFEPPTF